MLGLWLRGGEVFWEFGGGVWRIDRGLELLEEVIWGYGGWKKVFWERGRIGSVELVCESGVVLGVIVFLFGVLIFRIVFLVNLEELGGGFV